MAQFQTQRGRLEVIDAFWVSVMLLGFGMIAVGIVGLIGVTVRVIAVKRRYDRMSNRE